MKKSPVGQVDARSDSCDRRSGAVLVIMTLVMIALGALGISMIAVSTEAMQSRITVGDGARAYYLAESGVEYVKWVRARSSEALPNGLFVLPYDPWHFIRLADGFISENSIKPLLHSYLLSIKKSGQSVTEVECLSWNSIVKISPACVVDCTGEATLVDQAGGVTVQGEMQDGAVIFRVDGLSVSSQGERLALMRKIVHAAEKGIVHEDCRNISFVPGHITGRSNLLSVPIPISGENSTSLSNMEIHARRIVEELMAFFVSESYVSSSGCPMPAWLRT